MKRLYFLLMLFLLSGCTAAEEPNTAEQIVTPLAATAEPTATTPSLPEPPAVETGLTAEGAFYKGSLDAPVTMIDYSNFL